MMIVYRDLLPRGSCMRTPTWLQGALVVSRRGDRDGDIVYTHDIVLPDLTGVAFAPVDESWGVAAVGDGPLDTARLVRARPGLPTVGVPDARGRRWLAPALRDGDGTLLIALGWGRDEQGRLARQPEPWQAPLLHAADLARAELDAGRLGSADEAAVLAELALPLLCATHCLSPAVVLATGLMDDRLAINLLRVAAGYAPIED
jgi:hypothetical protein